MVWWKNVLKIILVIFFLRYNIVVIWIGIYGYHIDGLVQERCNSIANALELQLSCTNSSISICGDYE